MATLFSDIYDIALVVIDDYKLNTLYQTDEEVFFNYMQGFLISAIPEFSGCKHNLDYDLVSESFVEELTNKEKHILARFLVIKWLEREIQDSKYLNLALNTRDFKRGNESTNLKEKSEYLDRTREKINQLITDYQLEFM